MEDNFIQRYMFKFLMFIALISGLIYFYVDHFDFIIKSFQEGALHISNIAYILLRFFGVILLPVVFIVPSFFEFGRIKLARIFFILYGILHLVTASWVIYFLATNPYTDIFSAAKVLEFLKNGNFLYPIIYWDNTSIVSVIFTFIYAFAAIYTGIHFDKDKSLVKALVGLIFTLRIVLPLLYNIFSQGQVFSEAWLSYNIYELVSQLAFTIAIMYASSSNLSWIELIWDQLPFVENEDGQNNQFEQ